ncbi:MAG TPA: DHH family phosphoesterase [Candidatus Limnocylindrales bacterium]|nr:DHH family phosphoesterase [Candidatus Limnocylindrales bacterium]
MTPARPEVQAVAPEIWRVVQDHARLGAVTHKDADGDTLGSALGLALTLEPRGKRIPVVSSPPVPQAWWFLPGIERVNRDPLPQGSPLFVFDASDAERTGTYLEAVRHAPVVVNVDHHVTNAQFGTHNLVVTDAASTGELVYELLKAWQLPIPPAAASCLYASILSDTGGFRHDNTSEHALRAAAELVGWGADPVRMARGLFKSRSASTLRMQAKILQGLHFECGDRLVWASVRQEDVARSGATIDQADGAIDQLNTVRDQELAILFKEVSPDLTKVSVRSRDRVDAAALAALFGGGGHRRAAGIEMAMPIERAEEEVLSAARARLSEL